MAELYSWKVTFRPTMSLPLAMPFGKRADFDSSISRAVSTAPQDDVGFLLECLAGLVLVYSGNDLASGVDDKFPDEAFRPQVVPACGQRVGDGGPTLVPGHRSWPMPNIFGCGWRWVHFAPSALRAPT
jgi:hypothetical protein